MFNFFEKKNQPIFSHECNLKSVDVAPTDFLVFDNFMFKLAVIDILLYDLDCLGEQYNGGDEYFEAPIDLSTLDISKKELRQFPNLEDIIFDSLTEVNKKLLRKLKSLDIEINPEM